MEYRQPISLKRHINPSGFFGSLLFGALSGGAAGLAAGILARAAMRVVAVGGGMTVGFSITGTLGIFLIGTLLGTGPGILYAVSLPVWHAPPRRKGLVIGSSLAILIGTILFSMDAFDELALIPVWIIAVMFCGIALVYGVLLGAVAGRLVPESTRSETGSFLRTAGALTLTGGLVSGSIALFQAAAFPAASVVGPGAARFLQGLAGIGTILAAIAGTAGLLRSRAAGENGLVKAGLGITLALFTTLGITSFVEGSDQMGVHGLISTISLVQYNPDLLILLVLLGAGAIFILAAGVASLRAQRWTGWRRYTPLVVGLVPVLGIPVLHPGMLPRLLGLSVFGRSQLGYWVGAIYGMAWLALGIAMRAEAGRDDMVTPVSPASSSF